MKANKYYYLNIPDSIEELYFSVGTFERQIVFSGTDHLVIGNVLDRLPEKGGFLWGEMEEVSESIFNYWFQGSTACLNSMNWGKVNPSKPTILNKKP